MKLFFVSDIHGSMTAMNKVIKAFEKEDAGHIIVLGDLMYHGPRNPLPEDYRPADVAAAINKYKQQIVAVRGNCDAEVDQLLVEYPMMDTSAFVIDKSRRFFITHGHIYNPEKLPPLNNGDVFVYGHTHLPVAENRDGIFIFNPGSAALPKGGNPPSYGMYDGRYLTVKSFNGDVLASIDIK